MTFIQNISPFTSEGIMSVIFFGYTSLGIYLSLQATLTMLVFRERGICLYLGDLSSVVAIIWCRSPVGMYFWIVPPMLVIQWSVQLCYLFIHKLMIPYLWYPLSVFTSLLVVSNMTGFPFLVVSACVVIWGPCHPIMFPWGGRFPGILMLHYFLCILPEQV